MSRVLLGLTLCVLLFTALFYSGKPSQPAWAGPNDAAGTVTIPAGELWRHNIGYLDNHLAGFRRHVNNIRADKCYDRYLYRLTGAELAGLTLEQRRIVRITWKQRHWRAHAAESLCTPWYVTKQIWAGGILGRESSGDPWPNCPDPHDGSGVGWQGTVDCENGGRWLDSPGFYRCGLQFHPDWEQRFGRLCPA